MQTDEMPLIPPMINDPLKNLRPELHDQDREHRAYMLMDSSYDSVGDIMRKHDALHRWACIAASFQVSGLFIDCRQNVRELPYPEDTDDRRFMAIIGDREIEIVQQAAEGRPRIARAISKGPDYFHRTSLLALVRKAGMITVDATGEGMPMTYLEAALPLQSFGRNCILIECTHDTAREWMAFVSTYSRDCFMRAVLGETAVMPPETGVAQ